MRPTTYVLVGAGAALGALLLAHCATSNAGTGANLEDGGGEEEGATADVSNVDSSDVTVNPADGGLDALVPDVAAQDVEASRDAFVDDGQPDGATDAPADSQPGDDGAAGDAGDASDGAKACSAQNCGGACCGDTCVSSCESCDAGAMFCPFGEGIGSSNGVCLSDCSSCSIGGAVASTTCVQCSGSFTTMLCATSTDRCPASAAGGACACAPADGGTCPGPTQVCVPSDASASGGSCFTCGQAGTDTAICSSGGTCQADASACSH